MSETAPDLEDAAEVVYEDLSFPCLSKCDLCSERATHYFYARGEFSTFRCRDHRGMHG